MGCRVAGRTYVFDQAPTTYDCEVYIGEDKVMDQAEQTSNGGTYFWKGAGTTPVIINKSATDLTYLSIVVLIDPTGSSEFGSRIVELELDLEYRYHPAPSA